MPLLRLFWGVLRNFWKIFEKIFFSRRDNRMRVSYSLDTWLGEKMNFSWTLYYFVDWEKITTHRLFLMKFNQILKNLESRKNFDKKILKWGKMQLLGVLEEKGLNIRKLRKKVGNRRLRKNNDISLFFWKHIAFLGVLRNFWKILEKIFFSRRDIRERVWYSWCMWRW